MPRIFFVTHPDVVVDPQIPVPEWPLSPRGLARMRAGLRQPWLSDVRAIFSSEEQKAIDGAHVLGDALDLTPTRRNDLGENDRSSTGFLPQKEFEAMADAFFASPDESIRGWEPAADAQRRICAAVDAIVVARTDGDVIIVAHGAVGTLLLCHLRDIPIARAHDQPKEAVGGFYFTFDADTRELEHGWKRFDVLAGESRLDAERRRYAEEVRVRAGIENDLLIDAFATVPREAFFGKGPWRILGSAGYVTTPSDDPAVLYENILIAIDEARLLNNGEPTGLASWFDLLGLHRGIDLVHVGAGVGYYTSILAEAVGPDGHVTGIELDQDLADRARRNTEPWPWLTIESSDGAAFALEPDSADAIFVNAGTTEIPKVWLDALRPGARLVVPLTVSDSLHGLGIGHYLQIERTHDAWRARFDGAVGIYPCIGARTGPGNDLLRRAYHAGGHDTVRELDLTPHTPSASCWLHRSDFCLRR